MAGVDGGNWSPRRVAGRVVIDEYINSALPSGNEISVNTLLDAERNSKHSSKREMDFRVTNVSTL